MSGMSGMNRSRGHSANYQPGAAATTHPDPLIHPPHPTPVVRRSLDTPTVVALGKAVPRKGRMKAKRPPPSSDGEHSTTRGDSSQHRAHGMMATAGADAAVRLVPSDPHTDNDTLSHDVPSAPAALDEVDAAIKKELHALEMLKSRRAAARRGLFGQPGRRQPGPANDAGDQADESAMSEAAFGAHRYERRRTVHDLPVAQPGQPRPATASISSAESVPGWESLPQPHLPSAIGDTDAPVPRRRHEDCSPAMVNAAALRRQSWSGHLAIASEPLSTAAPQPGVANGVAARRRVSSPLARPEALGCDHTAPSGAFRAVPTPRRRWSASNKPPKARPADISGGVAAPERTLDPPRERRASVVLAWQPEMGLPPPPPGGPPPPEVAERAGPVAPPRRRRSSSNVSSNDGGSHKSTGSHKSNGSGGDPEMSPPPLPRRRSSSNVSSNGGGAGGSHKSNGSGASNGSHKSLGRTDSRGSRSSVGSTSSASTGGYARGPTSRSRIHASDGEDSGGGGAAPRPQGMPNERNRHTTSRLARDATRLPPPLPLRRKLPDLNLPEGWETAVNANGDTYYVDHVNKVTSWEHPIRRLSEEAQVFFDGTAL